MPGDRTRQRCAPLLPPSRLLLPSHQLVNVCHTACIISPGRDAAFGTTTSYPGPANSAKLGPHTCTRFVGTSASLPRGGALTAPSTCCPPPRVTSGMPACVAARMLPCRLSTRSFENPWWRSSDAAYSPLRYPAVQYTTMVSPASRSALR
eukprot:366282-Chlamydomonas_euryale.AAC.12